MWLLVSYGVWHVSVDCKGRFVGGLDRERGKVGFQLSYIDPTRTLLGLPFAIEPALLLW